MDSPVKLLFWFHSLGFDIWRIHSNDKHVIFPGFGLETLRHFFFQFLYCSLDFASRIWRRFCNSLRLSENSNRGCITLSTVNKKKKHFNLILFSISSIIRQNEWFFAASDCHNHNQMIQFNRLRFQ